MSEAAAIAVPASAERRERPGAVIETAAGESLAWRIDATGAKADAEPRKARKTAASISQVA
eukprot:152994-Prymnesium_polylepis.2